MIAVYVLATFAGGIVIGKLAKVRRFLWGLLLGSSYFLLLVVITLGVYHSLSADTWHLFSTWILCTRRRNGGSHDFLKGKMGVNKSDGNVTFFCLE
ncbi:TIGR04086 family membrane protein [uncultured Merdimonas sp.]|uniref:TIGR04086 family membrane protein n=1 Tax=uncultured Merdimonas sp. TaxID=2023269 RepID=UPI00320ADF6D